VYRFSALQRAEIAEIGVSSSACGCSVAVSVLFNEPKLLKYYQPPTLLLERRVSVLFNEPKLLKLIRPVAAVLTVHGFSALQRAEIAEMGASTNSRWRRSQGFSALQRAEIAEILLVLPVPQRPQSFQCSSTSRNC